jgi:hypothetical protein
LKEAAPAHPWPEDAPPNLYMDPDETVDENLTKTDGFGFDTFEAWYEMKVGHR